MVATRVSNRGRISKITPRQTRVLASIIKTDRRVSVRNLATEWSQAIGTPVGREWTRQHLKKLGYGFYKVLVLALIFSVLDFQQLSLILGQGKAFTNCFAEEKEADVGKSKELLD